VWPFPPDYLDPITDTSTYSSIEFNEAQTAALQDHIKWYVEPSSAVMEIGVQKSGVFSPTTNVKYSSLSDGAFAGKESEVIAGADGNTIAMSFPDESFDTVVVTSGIEAVKNPRELFRDVWRVLKPKGKCIICFGGKPNVSGGQPLRLWTTMNDEQKIWIAGSYYQYSTGAGWENIEG
jgi:SAM-dependent methyltransferase